MSLEEMPPEVIALTRKVGEAVVGAIGAEWPRTCIVLLHEDGAITQVNNAPSGCDLARVLRDLADRIDAGRPERMTRTH
jgi:hypothetical protein